MPPNAAGFSLGHIHRDVSDLAAQQKFWGMGGVPVANQKLEVIQFPRVYILLRRAATKRGTFGAIVNHLRISGSRAGSNIWPALGVAVLRVMSTGQNDESGREPFAARHARHAGGVLRAYADSAIDGACDPIEFGFKNDMVQGAGGVSNPRHGEQNRQ